MNIIQLSHYAASMTFAWRLKDSAYWQHRERERKERVKSCQRADIKNRNLKKILNVDFTLKY